MLIREAHPVDEPASCNKANPECLAYAAYQSLHLGHLKEGQDNSPSWYQQIMAYFQSTRLAARLGASHCVFASCQTICDLSVVSSGSSINSNILLHFTVFITKEHAYN